MSQSRSRSRSPVREVTEKRGGPRHNPADLFSVRIGGKDELPQSATDDNIKSIFSEYGDIADVFLPKDRDTRELRGFGFVRFLKKEGQENVHSFQKKLDKM